MLSNRASYGAGKEQKTGAYFAGQCGRLVSLVAAMGTCLAFCVLTSLLGDRGKPDLLASRRLGEESDTMMSKPDRELFNFFVSKGVEHYDHVLEVASESLLLSTDLRTYLTEDHYFAARYEASDDGGDANLHPSSFEALLFDVIIVTNNQIVSDRMLESFVKILAPGATLWIPNKLPEIDAAERDSLLGQLKIAQVHERASQSLRTWYEVAFEYRPSSCGYRKRASSVSELIPLPPDPLLDTRPEIQPIFIAGCGDSGTSLMLAMLGNHPDAFGLWETSTFYALNNWEEQAKRMKEWTAKAKAEGGSAWVEKTPSHVCRLGNILRYVPHARMIFISRHGDEVIPSLLHRPDFDFESAIARYVNDNSAGILAMRDPRVLHIKLEDIIEKPQMTMVSVCEHVRLPFAPDVLLHFGADTVPKEKQKHATAALRSEQLKKPLLDTTNHWKTTLTSEEAQRYRRAGEQGILKLLGYPIEPEPGCQRALPVRFVLVAEDTNIAAQLGKFLSQVPNIAVGKAPTIDQLNWNRQTPNPCGNAGEMPPSASGYIVTYTQVTDELLAHFREEDATVIHVFRWNKVDAVAKMLKDLLAF